MWANSTKWDGVCKIVLLNGMVTVHIIQQCMDDVYVKAHLRFCLCIHESPHGPTE